MINEGYSTRILLFKLTSYFDDDIADECLSELNKD